MFGWFRRKPKIPDEVGWDIIQEFFSQDRSEEGHLGALVDYSPWTSSRGKFCELERDYNFRNLRGKKTTIELRCRLTIKWARVQPFVHAFVEPGFLKQKEPLVAMFAPTDDLLGYKIIYAKVEAARTEQAPDGLNVIVFDERDGEHLVNVLKLGREITIKLGDFESNQFKETIAHLRLPNDATFRVEYERLTASLQASG